MPCAARNRRLAAGARLVVRRRGLRRVSLEPSSQLQHIETLNALCPEDPQTSLTSWDWVESFPGDRTKAFNNLDSIGVRSTQNEGRDRGPLDAFLTDRAPILTTS